MAAIYSSATILFSVAQVFICLLTYSCTGVWGLAIESSLSCAVRREISPCTCANKQAISLGKSIVVTCERMTSFEQVVNATKNKFDYEVEINLRISHSVLEDLPKLSFKQLELKVIHLDLIKNNLRALPETVFYGLNVTEHFSLKSNLLEEVPQNSLRLMPHIKTLDLSSGYIGSIKSDDFGGLSFLKTLILFENNITMLERNCFPNTVHFLQLSSNKIKSLNGTVRNLMGLEWFAVSNNLLETLEGELPDSKNNRKLAFIGASHNRLVNLTGGLANFLALEYIQLVNNSITSLDCHLARNSGFRGIYLTHNKIAALAANEFSELSILEELMLGWNNIRSLNGSLLPLKHLNFLNLTHNKIEEFNLEELSGLERLKVVDLTHNGLHTLIGVGKNELVSKVHIWELLLQFNELRSLSGSLMGLTKLHKLNLSNNFIEFISPDDLVGLDNLKELDISHNRLSTLYETSKTVLPVLEDLKASHNLIRSLERDFDGLPHLCWADLSYNKIDKIDPDLADKTQCLLYGVSSTLRIYLYGNPVLCYKETTPIIQFIESKNVEIRGDTKCEQFINSTLDREMIDLPMVNDISRKDIL